MKTAMQDTSLDAYFLHLLPNLGKRQKEVLQVFIINSAMDLTNAEVADDLEWSINRVTGRTQELRGEGKHTPFKRNPPLVWTERRPCRITKNMATPMMLNPYWHSGGYKID